MSTTTTAAASVAGLPQLELEGLPEITQYMLECNYPKLERIARRQRRVKSLSQAMEHFFMAEVEFQSRLLSAELDSAVDEMDLPRFTTSSLERAIQETRRGLTEASSKEKLYLYCMLGKLLVFQGSYAEAITQAFNYIKGEDLLALFTTLSSSGDDIEASTTPDVITSFHQIIGIQASCCKGIALEMTGRAHDAAMAPYSDVTAFCRSFPTPNLLKSRGFAFFVGMAMYRYGLLCSMFAVDPRLLQTVQSDLSIEQLRGRLLFDAAISLRMFLTFSPSAFGRIRHEAALTRYISALEGQFRRVNYLNALDSEQYTLTQGDSGRFSPETVAEDILYCTQLLETLQPRLPATKLDAQSGGSSSRVRVALGRLARYGHTNALVKMSKSLFTRYASEASTYGRLILACAASKEYEEGLRAGQIYVELGGRDSTIILIIAKTALLYRSKAGFAVDIIEKALKATPEDMMTNSLRIILGLAYLCYAYQNKDLDEIAKYQEKAVEILELAVVTDETDPQAHFHLSLAYLALKSAEDSIKVSLSIEADQGLAWYLFAVIKTAQRDYETCLSICNSFQENLYTLDIPISILRATVLGYLGGWEEAIQIIESLVSTFTQPSGPVIEEPRNFSAVQIDPPESPPSPILDPAQFRARFYSPTTGIVDGVITNGHSSLNVCPAQKHGLTLTTYKESFPDSVSQVLGKKLAGKIPFPECFLLAADVNFQMRSQSLLAPYDYPILLAQQLWCILGELHVAQGRLHQAELCEHEAFILNELDSRTFALKGAIQEHYCRLDAARECYQLGMQADGEWVKCLLGEARCLSRLKIPHHMQLALHAAIRAVDSEPTNVEALTMAADLSRQLNLDLQAAEYYNRAIQLDEAEPIIPITSILALVTTSLSL